MKTLSLILSLLLGGIVAFSLMGCASEWKCPKAPKVVAKFSVGDKVAYTGKFMSVWSSKSSPTSFWIDKGDTGVVTDIIYSEFFTVPIYEVSLDKAIHNERFVITLVETSFEAVVYPDPALAPRK